MKYLYKYPQRSFPIAIWLRRTTGGAREEFEYELLDTGVFDDDRYFDVFVEYAKGDPEDLLITISVHNRCSRNRPDSPVADTVVPEHVVLGRR